MHRSGRTGRVDRDGKCITLYESRDLYKLDKLEKMCRIQFDYVTLPKEGEKRQSQIRDLAVKAMEIARLKTEDRVNWNY